MRAVYKYPFPMMNSFSLTLPSGAKVVHADIQNGEPQLWAFADPNAVYCSRSFRIFATGQQIPNDIGPYIATLRDASPVGNPLGLIAHLFEATVPQPEAAE